MFRERYNIRQRALFHVLAAYSVYNTEVGYCQGMSQIGKQQILLIFVYVPFYKGVSFISAALLLMYLTEEEDAFWALHRLMNNPKYGMHGKQ